MFISGWFEEHLAEYFFALRPIIAHIDKNLDLYAAFTVIPTLLRHKNLKQFQECKLTTEPK